MIGFDIISLDHHRFSSKERMRAYARKILLPQEWEAWSRKGMTSELLHAFWALKECTYKIESRRGLPRSFCPKRFPVQFSESGTASIHTDLGSYAGTVVREGQYLIGMVAGNEAILRQASVRLWPLSSRNPAIQSEEVHQQLRNQLSDVSLQPEKLSFHLSISHDGYLGGYALLIPS